MMSTLWSDQEKELPFGSYSGSTSPYTVLVISLPWQQLNNSTNQRDTFSFWTGSEGALIAQSMKLSEIQTITH